MKENSIKEDIERLELCSTNQCYICGRYEKEECMLERTRCEAHILSDYKRVLKENEELKKTKITYEKVRDIQEKNKNIVDNNYIHKQKVKDKIKKLNNVSYAEELEDIMNRKNYTITELVQYVLQELIESEE